MDTATKTELDPLKSGYKIVVRKAAEATGNFIGSKIVKPKTLPAENSRNVEEIVIPPKK